MDEEAEREDSGSEDCDCGCTCVVEWRGGGLEVICAAGEREGDKNSLE